MKVKLLSALAAIIALSGFAADPYVGYIYPSGIQAGATNAFIVGGQNLNKLRGVHFGGDSLHVVKVEPVPRFSPPPGGQRRHLTKWLDAIAKGNREEPAKPDDPRMNEWRSNSWWRALGSLDPLKISIVERNLFVPRNSLQDAPSLRQMCIVTLAADANATLGRFDLSVWNDGGISAPRPFAVTEAPRFAEPLFSPAHRRLPATNVVDVSDSAVILDGQIMPGETDAFRLKLTKGIRYCAKVSARELQPYVGDAVPGFFNPAVTVRSPDGKIVAACDDTARFRPDPEFEFTPPDSGVYTIEIHDVLYRGRADFVYAIEVASGSAERASAFSGTVSKPGAKSVCEFRIDKPGERVFEVYARRRGSPLDAVLTVRKSSGGETLFRFDDTTNTLFVGTIPQAECDPKGSFFFREPGRYVAEITDRTGHGGDGYFWNLEIRRPRPGFAVYSTRSTLPIVGSKPLKVGFAIERREGFDGDVTLEFSNGIIARNNVATSGVDRITALLTYGSSRYLAPQPVKVYARAVIGGRTVRREVVPCDEYEQAFAWRHLVPAESFILRAVPPKKKGK